MSGSGPRDSMDLRSSPRPKKRGRGPRRPRRRRARPSTKVPRAGEHPVTSLTLVRRIAARPSIVFEALTTPEGLSGWWGPDEGPVLIAETDARVGGRFRVRFRMLDGSEHECHGEYLEVRSPERLVMTWNWLGGQEDPG